MPWWTGLSSVKEKESELSGNQGKRSFSISAQELTLM
jgi:hypothetical protein